MFLARPNRFIAQVELDGRRETVHVKNTGRCRELLLPGAPVTLAASANPARKTKYDLIAVEKETPAGPLLINMDSQAPNRVAAELLPRLLPDGTLLRPETVFGASRFDFYAETAAGSRWFVEVKGVTLEEAGVARFPDAPTQRGAKHLRELALAHAQGYETAVLFLIQMTGPTLFTPNDATDPAFATALREASAAGVHVWAWDCRVTPSTLLPGKPLPVRLE